MAEPTTVEVQLSPEELALLHADMAAGGYRTASELIQNALWEWHIHHGLSKSEIAQLRTMAAEGAASRPSIPVEFDSMFDSAEMEAAIVAAQASRKIPLPWDVLESGKLENYLRRKLGERGGE